MIRLIETGLFGHRLFPVDSELMVKRYNLCLDQIGIEPTKLKSFHIDGWGWSPEISDEKGDRYYLSHGLANPYGVIITPEQKNCPLYMPYHTFDWNIHRQIFDNYEAQIKDITADNAIWIELDQNVSHYRIPEDVLMMDLVHVRFNITGDVHEASENQKTLINEFLNEPNKWMDSDLRQKIIDSSLENGDLRYRNVEIPDFHRGNLLTYYTIAFDGMYVFKNGGRHKPIIILANDQSKISGDQKFNHVEFNISDHSFIPFLFNQQLVDIDSKFLKNHSFLIEDQMEIILIKAGIELDPELEVENLNESRKKGLINKLIKAGKLPDMYSELEILLNKLTENGDKLNVPAHLNLNLLHPHEDCSKEEKIVMWQLLSNVQDINPVMKYAFDKGAFFNDYQGWPQKIKDWAINKILNNRDVFHKLID